MISSFSNEGNLLLPTDKTKDTMFMDKDLVEAILIKDHYEDKKMYIDALGIDIDKRNNEINRILGEIKKSLKNKYTKNELKTLNNIEPGYPTLRLYIKDHKIVEEGSRPKSRPVIFAKRSADYIIAVIIEKILMWFLKKK